MLIAAILAMGAAHAQTGNFGAGVAVGDTTGLSLGYRPNAWNAVSVGVGYDLMDRYAKTSADYLRSVAVLDPGTRVRVPIYVGVGASVGANFIQAGDRLPVANVPGLDDVGADGDAVIAARVPIGASVLYMDAPVEVFVNAIPSLRVLPETRFDVDGTVGVRYHW